MRRLFGPGNTAATVARNAETRVRWLRRELQQGDLTRRLGARAVRARRVAQHAGGGTRHASNRRGGKMTADEPPQTAGPYPISEQFREVR